MKAFLNLPMPVKCAIGFLLSLVVLSGIFLPVVFFILLAIATIFALTVSVIIIISWVNLSQRQKQRVLSGEESLWSHMV